MNKQLNYHLPLTNQKVKFAKLLSWLITFSLVLIALASILSYLCFFPTKANYYATTTTGTVVQLHALSEPVVNDPYLLQWASVAVRDAYNFNFVDSQSKLDHVKQSFTSGGWDSFESAMKNSGLLDMIKRKKLIMTAVVSKAAIITHKEIYHGRFMWQVQMPMLITFDSASNVSHKHVVATLNISRVPVLEDPMGGIEINDFSVHSKIG